jgi:tryptophan synthase alpha subunit
VVDAIIGAPVRLVKNWHSRAIAAIPLVAPNTSARRGQIRLTRRGLLLYQIILPICLGYSAGSPRNNEEEQP